MNVQVIKIRSNDAYFNFDLTMKCIKILTNEYKFIKFIPLFLFSIGFFSSCASKKNIILFGDIKESTQNNVLFALPKIQVNDILDVKISTLNPETWLQTCTNEKPHDHKPKCDK